jgi:hypothetical protein
MSRRTILAAVLLMLTAAPAGLLAQSHDAAPPPANGSDQSSANGTDSAAAKDKKDKKSTSNAPRSTAAPAPQDAPPPDAPAAPDSTPSSAPKTATPAKGSTAADNPFPEDISKQAAAEAKAAATPATPARPTGSSSSEGLGRPGMDDGNRKQLKLESPDGSTDIYDPKRADEDLRVGKFYLKTGDAKGAYQRFKDATEYDHENAEAVYWLAESARRLNLSQEAAQNYTVYLAAVPDGPNAKAAKKALSELPSGTKP